jgi:hypothetical protein
MSELTPKYPTKNFQGERMVYAPSYLLLMAELLEAYEKMLRIPMLEEVREQIIIRLEKLKMIQPQALSEDCGIGQWVIIKGAVKSYENSIT